MRTTPLLHKKGYVRHKPAKSRRLERCIFKEKKKDGEISASALEHNCICVNDRWFASHQAHWRITVQPCGDLGYILGQSCFNTSTAPLLYGRPCIINTRRNERQEVRDMRGKFMDTIAPGRVVQPWEKKKKAEQGNNSKKKTTHC